MANFKATAESMRAAAAKVDSEAQNFESASKAAKSAADSLAASWEGDAQKVFVQEQDKANVWYIKMAEIVRQYGVFLRESAAKYEEADRQSASVIGAK